MIRAAQQETAGPHQAGQENGSLIGGISLSAEHLATPVARAAASGSRVQGFDAFQSFHGVPGFPMGHDTVTGGGANDTLVGTQGDDTLDGGAGADTMIGGLGNDSYFVDNVLDVVVEGTGGGVDTIFASVSDTAAANVENLTLTGGGDINALGNTLGNILTGNAGNNVLNGGAGADTLIGGMGNDTYVVGIPGDQIVEAAGGGIDTVRSLITWTLGDNLENLVLTGLANRNGNGNALDNTLAGNAGNNWLRGLAGNDRLSGNDGNDTLDGGTGADSMVGGQGNDTYLVDNAGDQVVEAAGAGTDTVRASIDYTLAGTLEDLSLIGSARTGSGNALNNTILGNASDNVLFGLGGDDSLSGGAGNDGLLGGAGNDTLLGGDGVDELYGDAGNDALMGGGGNDHLGVSDPLSDTIDGGDGIDDLFADYRKSADALNLTLGTAEPGHSQIINVESAIFLLGSAGDFLSAGASATTLEVEGGFGNDSLVGGAGGDRLSGGNGDDSLTGGAGVDTLLGGYNNDILLGGDGNDSLQGDEGVDSLNGGAGDDLLNVRFEQGGDTVDGGAGNDTLYVWYDDYTNGLNFTFGSTGPGTMQVTNLESVAFDLGSAPDYLSVGASDINLRYVNCGAGNDTVVAGVGDNSVSGYEGNDSLLGGDGADTLAGGTGIDALFGGAGDDLLTAEGLDADTVDGGAGFDTFLGTHFSNVPLNLTLGSTEPGTLQLLNVEEASLYLGAASDYFSAGSSAAAFTVSGASGNDTLLGGVGNDTLGGGVGNDELRGGAGDDALILDWGSDTIVLNSRVGSDSVSYFNSGVDKVMFSMGGLPVGDGDLALEGGILRGDRGGFDTSAEMVIFLTTIPGYITAETAAARIGSANSAYLVGQTALFVVHNASESGIYYFKSAGADAVVSASELTLLATLIFTPSTVVSDYLFGA